MIVQRARVPGSDRLVWLVVGEDHLPVEPIRRYLAYLDDVERSPNTLRAYAHHLQTLLGLPGLGKTRLDRRRARSARSVHGLVATPRPGRRGARRGADQEERVHYQYDPCGRQQFLRVPRTPRVAS